MKIPLKTLSDYKRVLFEVLRAPRFVNFFITSACTCRCIMCNFWRMGENFVDMDTFKQAVEVFEGFEFYNFSLTGGEPLFHPDYFKFIKYIKKRGLYANSPTNGTLLTEKNVRRLKECGVDSMGVSIDSLDPGVADKVRRHPGQLQKALNGLRLLKKYGIPRSAILIIAGHNIHDYCEMIKVLDEKFDAPSVLCFPDNGIGPLGEILFTNDELVKVVDDLLTLRKEGYRLMNTTQYLLDVKREYLGQRREIPCYGGYYMINVYWDGTVRPCFNKEPMGHIGELKELPKDPCNLCLNQCFIEFSYISECLARKQFPTALREWWNTIKVHF